MKWIVMKYAELFIALGDIQFRRGTSECLPLATKRYTEAARVLGPEPPNVPDLGNRKSKVLTYAKLRVKDNALDEVSLDLGLPFSFNIVPKGNATVSSTDPRMESITCILKTDYFSISLNPKFKTMRSLVQESLFNIRNSFDIQGNPVVYALRDPPIDPWMEKRLRSLCLQAYNLVLDAALRAQSAFSFEAGRKCSIIKPAGNWDASRNGLLAAQDLLWDLKKLEATQAENNSADYNITKTVSLKERYPMALMNLRIAGTCGFSLDELLFDMDFLGHYIRRTRSVAVSIPANFESNCSANAVLTLLSHKYRVTQTTADYVASQSASSDSFRTDRIPTSSIAVSNGDADSGVLNSIFLARNTRPSKVQA